MKVENYNIAEVDHELTWEETDSKKNFPLAIIFDTPLSTC